jgi:hypothetical protein
MITKDMIKVIKQFEGFGDFCVCWKNNFVDLKAIETLHVSV